MILVRHNKFTVKETPPDFIHNLKGNMQLKNIGTYSIISNAHFSYVSSSISNVRCCRLFNSDITVLTAPQLLAHMLGTS